MSIDFISRKKHSSAYYAYSTLQVYQAYQAITIALTMLRRTESITFALDNDIILVSQPSV